MSKDHRPTLVKCPQSGVVLNLEAIMLMGEPQPGQWLVVLDGQRQPAVVPSGDKNAIIEELRLRGLLMDLEMPKGAVAEGDKPVIETIDAPGNTTGEVKEPEEA